MIHVGPEHLAPGVGLGIDRVAQAVDQAAAVEGILVQDPGEIVRHAALVIPVPHVLLHVVHHGHHLAVGAAVAGTLQRGHGRGDGRIGICSGGGDHMVGEGGVVAAAVVRVEDQGHVQGPGLQIGVAAVLPQHPQEVLRGGQLRLGHVDKQALPLTEPPGLIGVDGQHGHIAHQLQALAQHILQPDVVGLVIIAEQRQDAPLHGVHQIPGRRLHNHVPEEIGGQRPVGGQLLAECLQLGGGGQFAEEQQIGRLFKGEAAPLGALHQLPAIDAPVVKHTVLGDDVLPLRDAVRLDLAHPGQAGEHAAAVLVPQAALDVILLIELGVDVVFLLPLLLQRENGGGDLTIGVLTVLFPDHRGARSFRRHAAVVLFAIVSLKNCIFNRFKKYF